MLKGEVEVAREAALDPDAMLVQLDDVGDLVKLRLTLTIYGLDDVVVVRFLEAKQDVEVIVQGC